MLTKFAVVSCTVLALAIGSVAADDFWNSKDWTQWSKSECNKILENSPWGKTGLVENDSSATKMPNYSRTANEANTGMSGQGTGELEYYISIYSAPPVQLAMLRQIQLDQKYDKKTGADKKAFDQKVASVLPKFKDDEIAVRVGYFSSKLNLEQGVGQFWQSLIPPGSIPDGSRLITEDGRTILPTSYRSTKLGEFFLTFPKSDGATPVIAEGTKTFKIQITSPGIEDFSATVVTVEFHVDQTRWTDKPVF